LEFDEDVRDQMRRAHRELRERLGILLDSAEASLTADFDSVIGADEAQLRADDRALEAGRNAAGPSVRIAAVRDSILALDQLRTRATSIADDVTSAERLLPAG
jgi:hypothetical protein